jgi:polyisoprenoid-binding protein YceI
MTDAKQAQTALTELPVPPGRWGIDPAHSSIVFSVRHLGLSKVRGRFDRFEAWTEVGATLEETKVTAEIDLASVDTNNADRDTHLRSTDFFNVEQHPTMRFESTRISGADNSWLLEGEVTLNGVTRALVLDVEFHGMTDFVDGKTHAGFSATGDLQRSDFGIDFGLLPIGLDKLALSDKVQFELDLQFVAPS